jgi:putative FmdB family regulatory protein
VPIYEYLCEDCGKRYEQIVLNRSQPVACPHCSSKRKTLQLSVFSAPAKANGGTFGRTSGGGTSGGGPSDCCGGGACGCN